MVRNCLYGSFLTQGSVFLQWRLSFYVRWGMGFLGENLFLAVLWRVLMVFVIAIAFVTMAGCGDRTVKSGVFIDSVVEGIQWESDGASGVTDERGRFEFVGHNTVRFFLGNVNFGEVSGDYIITPLDLADSNSLDNRVVLNIARLLQSLDVDLDASNGITLTSVVREAAVEVINFDQSVDDFALDPAVNTLVSVAQASRSEGVSLVSVTDARAHLKASLDGLEVTESLTANAGSNKTVTAGDEVILRGEISDATGQIVDFAWEQIVVDSEPAVILDRPSVGSSDSDPANSSEEPLTQLSVTFTAPPVTESVELTFQFSVENSDGLTVSDTVIITVQP